MADEKPSPQNAITDAFKERLSHPVYGAFAIAWVLINWKVLFFLAFAGSPAAYRIADVPKYCNGWTLAFWPLVATVVYVFAAPVLKAGALRWNDAVEDYEFERHYKKRLHQIGREQHLIQLQLQSGEPALKMQQENKVRLETEANQLAKRIDELKRAIRDLKSLSGPDWIQAIGENLPDGFAGDTLIARAQEMIARVDDLKKEMASDSEVWELRRKANEVAHKEAPKKSP